MPSLPFPIMGLSARRSALEADGYDDDPQFQSFDEYNSKLPWRPSADSKVKLSAGSYGSNMSADCECG